MIVYKKLYLNLALIICSIFCCSLIACAEEPYQLMTKSEDIALTDDLQIAKAQVMQYPDNIEAHFNLAIALSRTSAVEETILQLRKTKVMILKEKDISIIDKKINEYNEMLENDKTASNIRYRLAFSHYLKAYFIAKAKEKAEKDAKWSEVEKLRKEGKVEEAMALRISLEEKQPTTNIFDSDKSAKDSTNPIVNENIDLSIKHFETILKENPNDIWSKVYYAFIIAEQKGEFDKAKQLWAEARDQDPNNPAPHFFLGESYLKDGNLKEGLSEISKALILRSSGK